jgi:hypothetical protein
VIGGVIVNAIDNSDNYSRTDYAPPSGYYYNDGYGSSGYYNNGYGYYGGGYYDRGYGTTYYNGPAPTYYSPGYYYGDGY